RNLSLHLPLDLSEGGTRPSLWAWIQWSDMNGNDLVAHTPARGKAEWHSLAKHSQDVACLASAFADLFGARECAWLLGLVHDSGKADPRFQRYLEAAHQGVSAPKCNHAFAGAVAGYSALGPAALAVAGHHAGLADKSEWASLIKPNADLDTVEHAKAFLSTFHAEPWPRVDWPDWAVNDDLACEMLIRMVFSCLVDADRLDTEAHFDRQSAKVRGSYQQPEWYLQRLDSHLRKFDGHTGLVNELRREILNACRNAASKPPGVFSLTVPTGGGKTLSGLAFALEHAVRHGKRRVVVAIPYTSIIDQTGTVLGGIFGSENLLEHHSAVQEDDDETFGPGAVRRRLAAENWDCPLVLTTTVQLFESLLSNKPGKCRKLHNLADSVLIVDEVQALPEKCLKSIVDALYELSIHYGVTVVLSTATPPNYETVDSRLQRDSTEIVPDYPRHFQLLKRVRFEYPQEDWTLERLRGELEAHNQALVVLNTRKDAIRVVQAAHGLDGLAHLSTLLCGHHRKKVLAEVRGRLKDRKPVRLISTQVVEAGVDVDFPKVYRVLGPLDRIVQVAGRCNREGRLDELGTCTVFQLEGAKTPRGPYATGTALTGPLLEEFGQAITEPDATARYTAELYRQTETGDEVQQWRRKLAFRTVAENFKMIKQETVPVIVESYDQADVKGAIGSWEARPGGWFRRIAGYTVNVYQHEVERLRQSGAVRKHESGAWVYSGPYDRLLGLATDVTDPADLVA
ncbi:MAG: CRISPR-associated helicase Cas3', partial [Nitrospirae bacterium]|nr:CRISPR-associated helicase Cas3' [Fimbriimonadaceae bacterium]